MLDSSSLPSLPSAGVSLGGISASKVTWNWGQVARQNECIVQLLSSMYSTLCITEGEGAVGLQGRALALALAPLSARRCSPPSPPPLSTEASPFFFLPACRGSSCCCRYSCSTVDCWLKSGEFKKQPLSHLMLQRLRRAPGFFRLDGAASSTQYVHNCNPSTFRHYVVDWSTSSQGGNQRDKPNRARHRRMGPPCQPPRLDRPRTAGGTN